MINDTLTQILKDIDLRTVSQQRCVVGCGQVGAYGQTPGPYTQSGTTLYGQQAGSIHPTGMHPCSLKNIPLNTPSLRTTVNK